MQKSIFQFSFSELNLNIDQVGKVLGCKSGESLEAVSSLISDVFREAEEICTIRAEYEIFPAVKFVSSTKSIVINDIIFNINKIVYGQIKKSESVALFLCTAGEEIGYRSKRAMKDGDLLKGYIYDITGSEIAEAAADIMQNILENKVSSEGKRITNRYSPGYCGWDVVEQHKLFTLFPYNFCGIRLTPSALMDPVKSVSGLIGTGENVKRHPYTCSLCDMQDCIYRKKKP